VAAALSGDKAMLADYAAGDCYLAQGKSLGLIPARGTAESHRAERRLCKVLTLATLYGQKEAALARRIGKPVTVARDLLRRHRKRYAAFWKWSDATLDYARLHGRLRTRLGWQVHVGRGTREGTWRNWRVQATAAEVMRLATCYLTEGGLTVCGTVHDAALVEAPADAIDAAAAEAERLMVRASVEVLGVPLRVDRTVVRHPDRLLDPGGRATWERVWGLVNPPPAAPPTPIAGDRGTPIAGDTPVHSYLFSSNRYLSPPA
jgi:DNA polymerase I-like protein with 3'-5' exonuclease and polymerase domains